MAGTGSCLCADGIHETNEITKGVALYSLPPCGLVSPFVSQSLHTHGVPGRGQPLGNEGETGQRPCLERRPSCVRTSPSHCFVTALRDALTGCISPALHQALLRAAAGAVQSPCPSSKHPGLSQEQLIISLLFSRPALPLVGAV